MKYILTVVTEKENELTFTAPSRKEAAKLALNKGIVSEKGKLNKGFSEAKIVKEGEDIEDFSFHWYGVLSPYQYDWSAHVEECIHSRLHQEQQACSCVWR